MKALNEKKANLLTLKTNLERELETIGDQISESFTNDKINTDKLATQSNTIQAKLSQLDKELVLVDQAIEDEAEASKEREKQALYNKRCDHVKSACEGIREAWKLQEKLSTVLQAVIEHEDKAVTNQDDIILQARLMLGSLMAECRLHFVSASSVASLNKNTMPEEEVARLCGNLRRVA